MNCKKRATKELETNLLQTAFVKKEKHAIINYSTPCTANNAGTNIPTERIEPASRNDAKKVSDIDHKFAFFVFMTPGHVIAFAKGLKNYVNPLAKGFRRIALLSRKLQFFNPFPLFSE